MSNPTKFGDIPRYTHLQWVEKFRGEALWKGRIVSSYYTTRSKLRYVVEVWPQGFQMIATPDQLRACSVPEDYAQKVGEASYFFTPKIRGDENKHLIATITPSLANRLFGDATKTLVKLHSIDPTDYEWPLDAPQIGDSDA